MPLDRTKVRTLNGNPSVGLITKGDRNLRGILPLVLGALPDSSLLVHVPCFVTIWTLHDCRSALYCTIVAAKEEIDSLGSGHGERVMCLEELDTWLQATEERNPWAWEVGTLGVGGERRKVLISP